jgi:uncharacterized alkaline shock family protein YloU
MNVSASAGSPAAAGAAPGDLVQSRSAGVAGDSGRRGSLEISNRAVERIAEIAARRVGAVVRQPATFGRGLPSATAKVAGQHVRLDVKVVVRWGRPLPETAAAVRSLVAEQVSELTGLVVDAVAVDIVAFATDSQAPALTGPGDEEVR